MAVLSSRAYSLRARSSRRLDGYTHYCTRGDIYGQRACVPRRAYGCCCLPGDLATVGTHDATPVRHRTVPVSARLLPSVAAPHQSYAAGNPAPARTSCGAAVTCAAGRRCRRAHGYDGSEPVAAPRASRRPPRRDPTARRDWTRERRVHQYMAWRGRGASRRVALGSTRRHAVRALLRCCCVLPVAVAADMWAGRGSRRRQAATHACLRK